MSSVTRSLELLEFVVESTQPPTHADLARALKIPKSTLSLLLTSLQQAGHLTSVDRHYYPGVRLVALAFRISHAGPLRSAVRPVMDKLAEDSGETVLLGLRVGAGIINVEQSPSRQPVRYLATLGQLRPIHATATGRVFLAFTNTSAHSLGKLDRVTPATETDARALEVILKRVRRDGYAISRGEAVPDVWSISAPIFDNVGQPVAAMSVTGPSYRLGDLRERVWPLLKNAIRSLSSDGQAVQVVRARRTVARRRRSV